MISPKYLIPTLITVLLVGVIGGRATSPSETKNVPLRSRVELQH